MLWQTSYIQRGFTTSQPVWDPKSNPKSKLSPNPISNAVNKYIIIVFSIVNNPYPCRSYIFITENYSLKFTIMSFWAPATKSPAENGIPKEYLDTWLKRLLLVTNFKVPISHVWFFTHNTLNVNKTKTSWNSFGF